METSHKQELIPIKLVYLIGTYPELTNTFIDREIATLRHMGQFQIQIMSIRYPHTIGLLSAGSCSPEQKALFQETLYLIPPRWSRFNYSAFILANLYFVFTRPLIYFRTFIDLTWNALSSTTHSRAGLKTWMKTVLYFMQGVYAANLLRMLFIRRHENFDHLHVHFMDRAVLVALVVSRLLGKTYSFTAHAADIYTDTLTETLVRQKIDNARFMITVSQYNKEHLLNAYPGINADKIHILHPWVDVSQFTPYSDRPIHDSLHILSVGRLVEKKGHLDLIDAFYLYNEVSTTKRAECWIVGEGPLRTELEERIADHGLQDCIHLLGALPQDQVLNLLKEWADVFVLPCVIAGNGDRDGIPVSIAEAMAMELPIISTDIVGIRELVQPGTGILVPPHDPTALAEALHVIATQDQPATVRMGRNGREVVDREFNLLKGTQELAGYFIQAIRKGKGRIPAPASTEKKVRNVSI